MRYNKSQLFSIKIILLINFLSISAFADFSLLAPTVPAPLAELNALVTQRSAQVQSKLKNIENGVIQNIQDQIETKKYNTERLRKLSKLDYVTNSEYLFLLKKINKLTETAIDSQNATTNPKIISPNINK